MMIQKTNMNEREKRKVVVKKRKTAMKIAKNASMPSEKFSFYLFI